ncbi:aldose 1-epimerase [Clostridium algifaecis]|uniref:Aldose 1-epimerase n=1 Tax=Clostridium algifaecis TaxID=1472040 RepID=A0ABS4KYC4_9CLOT|nr:aldose 1-epimerase [Clostridium algifaecis]MBP2033879.1 aldose 1-epimerase [Clostridium algifaecis]
MGTEKNDNACIKETTWMGKKCIRFYAGGYEALMIPEVGANVMQLKDTVRGLNLLRTPPDNMDFEKFKNRPQVYGLPILFPPNRIEDGKFKVGDKEYKFPINEPKRNNYIHGFIKSEKWEASRIEILNKEEIEVEAIFNYTKDHEFYKYFPHEFQAKLTYNLSNKGLKQTTSVINKSSLKMPLGIGFHTSFNIPFHPESSESDCKLIASIDKRWEQDDRNLPTEKILDLTADEKKYLHEGIVPKGYPIESHYMLKPMNFNGHEFKGAIFEDRSKQLRLVYEMGKDYKHIVIWNDMGDKEYVCVEPQTCMINAPNVNMDDKITGFKTLEPGELWSEVCKIYLEEIK